ncbi:mCG145683, partial [Mus musculus]
VAYFYVSMNMSPWSEVIFKAPLLYRLTDFVHIAVVHSFYRLTENNCCHKKDD